jgi:hypothetical protein
MIPTKVRVRAQAHGGKYIGPAVAKPPVLSVFHDGRPIVSDMPMPNKQSGTVVDAYTPDASPFTIVVQPPQKPSPYYPAPGTYWLTPPASGTADVELSFNIDRPLLLEFRVTAYAPAPVHGTMMVTIVPGFAYTEPGIVVPVSGLYVPSVSAQYGAASRTVHVAATVQMLCGCPITQQPATTPPTTEPYWPSNEFVVNAAFYDSSSGAPVATIPLACTGLNAFGGNLALAAGTYGVWLSALQPATMNGGSGTAMNVVVP